MIKRAYLTELLQDLPENIIKSNKNNYTLISSLHQLQLLQQLLLLQTVINTRNAKKFEFIEEENENRGRLKLSLLLVKEKLQKTKDIYYITAAASLYSTVALFYFFIIPTPICTLNY